MFTHACTSILTEWVFSDWVHAVHQLVSWNWGEGSSMIDFQFVTQSNGTFFSFERLFKSNLPKICTLLVEGRLIVGISTFLFSLGSSMSICSPHVIAGSRHSSFSTANYNSAFRVRMFLVETRVYEPIVLSLHCGNPINWNAFNILIEPSIYWWRTLPLVVCCFFVVVIVVGVVFSCHYMIKSVYCGFGANINIHICNDHNNIPWSLGCAPIQNSRVHTICPLSPYYL